jgi:hypothetical protein
MGLKKWVQDNWVDIANKKKMVLILNVEEAVEKKERIIQNVFLLQKLEP